MIPSSPSEAMYALLRESPDRLVREQQERFRQECAARGNRIVLFGAGGLGRKAARGLQSRGIEPLAFADNDSDLWGRQADGAPVLAPRDAAERYGDEALFVVAIWSPGSGHRYVETRARLQEMGCTAVASFIELFRSDPE